MSISVHNGISVSNTLKNNDVLRRYLDNSKFLSFLDNPGIHLCRGDHFEDKFEGAFTDSIKKAIKASYEQNGIDYSYEKFKEQVRRGTYISSWSEGLHDNMALWKLYGGAQCSVALTTTVWRLKEAIEAFIDRETVSIVKVTYLNHWKDPKLKISPYANVFAYKTKAFSYENEVRVILDRHKENFEQRSIDSSVFIPINPNDLIRSIVVSPDSPDWFVDSVSGVVKKYGYNFPVKRSKLSFEPV